MVVAYFITAVYMFVGWLILLIHMLKVSEELSTRCSDCGLQTSDNLRVKAQKQAELIRKLEDELENLKNYVKSFA